MSSIHHRLAVAAAMALITVAASAQQAARPAPQMPGMTGGQNGTTASPSSADREMTAGMTKMNIDMSGAPMTGDADRDFVAMMIPHHQGAIDMAQAELKYGKDPTLRQLAKDIVSAQEKEIAEMHSWQAKHSSQ